MKPRSHAKKRKDPYYGIFDEVFKEVFGGLQKKLEKLAYDEMYANIFGKPGASESGMTFFLAVGDKTTDVCFMDAGPQIGGSVNLWRLCEKIADDVIGSRKEFRPGGLLYETDMEELGNFVRQMGLCHKRLARRLKKFESMVEIRAVDE